MKILKFIGFWLSMLVILLVFRAVGGTAGEASGMQALSIQEDAASAHLKAVSDDMNQMLPQMIDEELRWDTTYSVGITDLVYMYSYPNWNYADLDVPRMKENLVRSSKPVVCSEQESLTMLNTGIKILYVFKSKDNLDIVTLSFSKKDCLR